MQVDITEFKKYILETGLVTQDDITLAETQIADAKKTGVQTDELPEKLVSMDLLEPTGLTSVQAHLLGLEMIDLRKEEIDMQVLSLIPEPLARKNNIVAYAREGKNLHVAMLDPRDLSAIQFVEKKTGLKISTKLTDIDSIKNVLGQYQKDLQSEFGDILEGESGGLRAIDDEEDPTNEDLEEAAQELPVIRIVDTLLKHAILQNASDIHIEPQDASLTIRYRVDGILMEAMTLPKRAAGNITARIKVLSNLKLDEKRLPQDGRFKVEADSGEKVSFRVSVLPVQYGEKIVMRLLRENVRGFTLEKLGFHGVSLERIHFATKQRTGLILVTGPTGSGKSTTLYTILDIVNTPDVNISTVEDPVEYQMPGINQSQVKPGIGFTFAAGLRSLMRQDPDVIMVGEIRDQETGSLAINAALTGHLVMSTIHTNSAAGAIPRMIDMGIEPFLISSTIKVAVGQRLVRRLASDKVQGILKETEIKELEHLIDMDRVITMLKDEGVVPKETTWETMPVFRATENGETETGYAGRAGIHEVFKISAALNDMIISRATTDEMHTQSRTEGMLTMLEDGIFKAVQGTTTVEEVLRVISE